MLILIQIYFYSELIAQSVEQNLRCSAQFKNRQKFQIIVHFHPAIVTKSFQSSKPFFFPHLIKCWKAKYNSDRFNPYTST